MDYKKVTEDLIKWVGDYAKKVGAKGFIFGLSGGIDSAVIAAIAKRVPRQFSWSNYAL